MNLFASLLTAQMLLWAILLIKLLFGKLEPTPTSRQISEEKLFKALHVLHKILHFLLWEVA